MATICTLCLVISDDLVHQRPVAIKATVLVKVLLLHLPCMTHAFKRMEEKYHKAYIFILKHSGLQFEVWSSISTFLEMSLCIATLALISLIQSS